jgi:hypothetical protein
MIMTTGAKGLLALFNSDSSTGIDFTGFLGYYGSGADKVPLGRMRSH